jgi:hypothetical protein
MFIHATKGVAAAAISIDDGPVHDSSVNAEITDPYEVAAERNSADNPFQAVAAACIDPDPGPAYIRAEFISGGNAPKSMAEPSAA